ncbi:hypothetical protein NE237_013451 [Protea cynaroides]|uniref:Low-temperature-induced 65 kDa protein n=1 Tax=Protea cynaroides TaxID=273540 RepID=A0A9Q0GZD5_9MAGN|nr:hypothetical protein NE237_013451 [Protea cynaroides]
MDSHHHSYDADPHNTGLHNVVEGEDEHHEKKSVLKKVKDKAKKLKDTLGIKKHGHGHEGEHGDHDHEVEDDEGEEEFEQDSETHGAQMYEATAARIVLTLHKDTLGQSGAADSGPTSQFPSMEKDPQAPKNQFDLSDPGNRQPKTTNRTGPVGKEARVRVTPLINSFGTMEISNEACEHNPWSSTERNDQFSSDLPVGENFQVVPKIGEQDNQSQASGGQEQQISSDLPVGENSQVVAKIGEQDNQSQASGGQEQQISSDLPVGENSQVVAKIGEQDNQSQASEGQEQQNQSSYTEKISAATSTITEKAISAKNVVASKLGYGENDDTSKPATVVEYSRQVAATVTEKLAPVYEKVAEAGNTVVSKMQGTVEETEGKEGGNFKRVSVKEYVVEKLMPSEEDKVLSEVIMEALHRRKGEEPQPLGKVTESPELARRLGTDSDNNKHEGFSPGNEAGKGMAHRLKGVVTSWFGKNGEQKQQQDSLSFSPGGGDEVGENIGSERRLNDSTN